MSHNIILGLDKLNRQCYWELNSMQNEMTYMGTQTLNNIILRVSKADSSFVYFTFESNEGICFYSTLESSLKKDYRDMTVFFTPEFKEDVERILGILSNRFPIEILEKNEIKDSH